MAERPLRALALVPALGGGGAEKHVERLASAIPGVGVRMDVAVVRAGGDFERFLSPDVRLHALRPWALGSGTLEMVASLPALRRLLVDVRYDALLAFLDRPSLAALAVVRTIPARTRPALVLSVQNDPISVFDDDPLGAVFRASMQHLFVDADAVVALSEGVAARVREIAPRLSPVVLPNACVDDRMARDLDALPTRTTDATRDLVVVACGRLAPQKGFDVLLSAFALVHARMPNVRLRILGTGPLEADLRSQCARLGLESHAQFVGFVSAPALEFGAADVFCLSSRYEGLGMVIVEAMAAGAPVVATDCPHGPREILRDGKLGWLAKVDDPESLAAALLEALSSPDERARISELGRARAADYRSDVVAAGYADLLRRVVRSRRASSASSR